MIVQIENFQIKQGAFADVLIDKSNMIVLKLFKSYNHPDLNGTGKESISETITNEFRKKVFESEKQAYINIQNSELLKKFTPKYFGNKIIDKVTSNNIEISSNYLLDCCLILEFIIGDDYKLYSLLSDEVKTKQLEKKFFLSINEIINSFIERDVLYTLDSSVIYNDIDFKIIDFATKNFNDFEPIIQ
jgi:hypothetical protein